MMFKKKLMTSVMAAALAGGALLSGGAQAVRLSETGQGQFLMGGLYMAQAGGYKTRVTVTNPTDNAVKAKVVLRSRKHSSECADFIMYLSPRDVGYFEITADPRDGLQADGTAVTALAPGQAAIWSDDDSLLSSLSMLPSGLFDFSSTGGTKFASQNAWRSVTLAGHNATTGQTNGMGKIVGMEQTGHATGADSCDIGHFEVYGLYAAGPVGAVVNTDYGAVTVARPMSKFEVAKIFLTNKSAGDLALARANSGGNFAPGSLVDLNTANAASGAVTLTSASVANSQDHANRVQLMGSAELRRSDNSDRIVYPLAALRDGVTPGAAVPSYVISNPAFDGFTGAATMVGFGFDTTATRDSLADIDAALTTASLRGFYEAGVQARDGNVTRNTNLVVTYPTKYRHRTTNVQNSVVTDPPAYNAPFTPNGAVGYTLSSWDTQERSSVATPTGVCFQSPCGTATVAGTFMNDEVNYIYTPTLISTAGWHQVNFTTPMPAIGYVHRYDGAGMTNSVFEPMTRANVVR